MVDLVETLILEFIFLYLLLIKDEKDCKNCSIFATSFRNTVGSETLISGCGAVR